MYTRVLSPIRVKMRINLIIRTLEFFNKLLSTYFSFSRWSPLPFLRPTERTLKRWLCNESRYSDFNTVNIVFEVLVPPVRFSNDLLYLVIIQYFFTNFLIHTYNVCTCYIFIILLIYNPTLLLFLLFTLTITVWFRTNLYRVDFDFVLTLLS